MSSSSSEKQENQIQDCQNQLQLQEKQYFKYGRYLFKNQLKQYLESAQVYKEEIKEKLKRESLQIKRSKCIEIWAKIFVNIIQAEIDQIDYRVNNNSNIIKEISHIYFKQLKTLYLHQNNINNIEVLPIINCQNLQNLCLDQNQISRINCMKKWSHSNLYWFALAKNPICQIPSFAKMKFRKVITYLRFEQYQNHNVISEDLSILLKLNNQIIQIMHHIGKKRLKQPKVKQMIKLRHKKIEV